MVLKLVLYIDILWMLFGCSYLWQYIFGVTLNFMKRFFALLLPLVACALFLDLACVLIFIRIKTYGSAHSGLWPFGRRQEGRSVRSVRLFFIFDLLYIIFILNLIFIISYTYAPVSPDHISSGLFIYKSDKISNLFKLYKSKYFYKLIDYDYNKMYNIYFAPFLLTSAAATAPARSKELTILPTIPEVPTTPNPLDPDNIFGLQ